MESRAWVGVRVRANHLWAFLVDHFLSAEALPHDLIVRLAHDLNTDQTTAYNHKQALLLFQTHISTSLVVRSSPQWGFCWADRCSCQENLWERKKRRSVCSMNRFSSDKYDAKLHASSQPKHILWMNTVVQLQDTLSLLYFCCFDI